MANEVLHFDGSRWVSAPHRYWDGRQWAPASEIFIWDGSAWRGSRPQAVEFPSYIASRQASFTEVDTATLPLPSGVRLGDVIVSVCASYGDSTPTPQALSSLMESEGLPARPDQSLTFDPTKLHLKASMYEWTPDKGMDVTWHVSGHRDTNGIVMNMVYRQADTAVLPAEPIVDYTTAMDTDSIPLQAGTDHTSLYVVMALSKELTGGQWPEGFTNPVEALGRFGEAQVHLMAAHTVGAMSSPGTLQLDATVPEVAAALITIPGRPPADGRGVWILGDTTASVLGVTTYVE